MILNTNDWIRVKEIRTGFEPRYHRVVAWTDNGVPLILGVRGLHSPRFRRWVQEDKLTQLTVHEQHARNALADELGRRGELV